MTRVAFITGITGQDGSYLAEFLLEKGYIVHGLKRRHAVIQSKNIDHIRDRLQLHYGDMSDPISLVNCISQIKATYFSPNSQIRADRLEVYNLAAQSHVHVSFQVPSYTASTDGLGVLNLLEAIRMTDMSTVTRLYQASTSELYGLVQSIPQSETTPFYPRSPYAVAKLYGHWIVKNYREAYGMFACSGILFNHESPRRGENFVTRKITIGVNKFCATGEVLELGNLESLRDWGHARDYVRGMWLMLQQENPEDFVLATGKQVSVRVFVEKAFAARGRTVIWNGEGADEVGIDTSTGQVCVRVNGKYLRPSEVDTLLGDPTKARTILGWAPTTTLDDLVREMVEADATA